MSKPHIQEIQAHLIDNSKLLLSEVKDMLEKYYFYDLFFYASFKINSAIRDGEAIADQPVVVIEYMLSLLL
jgi:hypothetical protein